MSMLARFSEVSTPQGVFEAFLYFLSAGGYVMPPLMLIAGVVWFAIGWRWMLLNRGSQRSVRVLIQNRLRGKGKAPDGIVDEAVLRGLAIRDQARPNLRRRLDEAFGDYDSEIRRYSRLIGTLVAIAPLLGLLGTVVGMIETFDSLGDMSLFSQTGGIAAGIATALFTTQLGLVVAVPAVIAKSVLDRRQAQIEIDLAQIKDILCTELAPASGDA